MPKSCCVFGCSSRAGKDDVHFYRLPRKKPELLKKWLHNMRTKTAKVNSNTRVCSKHFVGGKKRGLNDVPSVFVWRKDCPGRRPPRERSQLPASRECLPLQDSVAVSSREEEVEESCASENDQLSEGELESGMSEGEILPTITENPVDKLEARVKTFLEVERGLKEHIISQEQIIADLSAQNKILLEDRRFHFDLIRHDKELVRFYTGLPDADVFTTLFQSLTPFFEAGIIRSSSSYKAGEHHISNPRTPILSKVDELFLTLMRLRMGAPLADLAFRFKIHLSTASRIFTTYLDLLYRHFEAMKAKLWPSRAQVDALMPEEFKRHFCSTRCVVDCTELMIEKPSDPDLQRATWSSYKNHNTLKALLAITPDGCLSFVSELYGGSVSDREIVESCDFLTLIEPGDSVMADKGFKVKDLLEKRGATLNIPPYLEKKDQLSHQETVVTRRIAKLRIHVERQMERVKNFHILDFLPISLCDISNKNFMVCAWLTQFQPPLCP